MQQILEAYYILYDDEAKERYDKEYERVYERKGPFSTEKAEKTSQTNTENRNESKNFDVDDPVLEQWIDNAKKQAFDFIKNAYSDSKGITKNGCKYFFYGLGINVIIFILILLIIVIYKLFKK